MPKDSERRRILNEWKAGEIAKAEAELPAPKEILLDLFDDLERRLSETPCDHSLRFTLAWADRAGVDGADLLKWARLHGGYCDCEVASNVREGNLALGR